MRVPKSSQQRARRQGGTASVEVVMMLPFFMILFGGLYYMYGHYMGQQQAMLRARSCTWRYAADGCRDPDGLNACLAARAGGASQVGADQANEESDTPPVPPGGIVDSDTPAVLEAISSVPLLGNVVKWLFGVPVTVRARQPVTLLNNMVDNKEKIIVSGKYYTMCNTVPRGWACVAKETFCEFVGSFPGCDGDPCD